MSIDISRLIELISRYKYLNKNIKDHIKEIPVLAYLYARDVIKGRWPEAEKYIMKDPRLASYYAMYIIKDRLPDWEAAIKKDRNKAYAYAVNFLGYAPYDAKRWVETSEDKPFKLHEY